MRLCSRCSTEQSSTPTATVPESQCGGWAHKALRDPRPVIILREPRSNSLLVKWRGQEDMQTLDPPTADTVRAWLKEQGLRPEQCEVLKTTHHEFKPSGVGGGVGMTAHVIARNPCFLHGTPDCLCPETIIGKQ